MTNPLQLGVANTTPIVSRQRISWCICISFELKHAQVKVLLGSCSFRQSIPDAIDNTRNDFVIRPINVDCTTLRDRILLCMISGIICADFGQLFAPESMTVAHPQTDGVGKKDLPSSINHEFTTIIKACRFWKCSSTEVQCQVCVHRSMRDYQHIANSTTSYKLHFLAIPYSKIGQRPSRLY